VIVKEGLNLFQPSKATIHNPIRASGGLKMGNCFLLPYISGTYLPIALIKKSIMFSRYSRKVKGVCDATMLGSGAQ